MILYPKNKNTLSMINFFLGSTTLGQSTAAQLVQGPCMDKLVSLRIAKRPPMRGRVLRCERGSIGFYYPSITLTTGRKTKGIPEFVCTCWICWSIS